MTCHAKSGRKRSSKPPGCGSRPRFCFARKGEDRALANAGLTSAWMNGAAPVLIGYDGSGAARRAIRETATLFGSRRALVVTVWEPGLAYEVDRMPAAEPNMALSSVRLQGHRRSTKRLRLAPIGLQMMGLSWRSPSDFKPRRSSWPRRHNVPTRSSSWLRSEAWPRSSSARGDGAGYAQGWREAPQSPL